MKTIKLLSKLMAMVLAVIMLSVYGIALAVSPPVTISGHHPGSASGNSSDGGFTRDLPAISSTLNIESGADITDIAIGAYAVGDVTGNTVNMTGGTVASNINGGYSPLGVNQGNAVNNSVYISGGTANGNIYGGYGKSATGNSVTISGGTLMEDGVYGGDAESGDATGNTVTISGGVFIHTMLYIFGGYAPYGNATGNTMTIGGSPTFGGDTYLRGGYADASSNDSFTGNTLNKNSAVFLTVASHFENISFGYSGEAGIGSLDIAPYGASGSPLVKLDTQGNDITFSGNITGNGGIEKHGAGKLVLSGTNGYTGETIVAEGTLEFSATSSPPSGTITVKPGATIINNSSIDIIANGRTLTQGERYTEPLPTLDNVPKTGDGGYNEEGTWVPGIIITALLIATGVAVAVLKRKGQQSTR